MELLVTSPKALGAALQRQRKAKKLTQNTVGSAFKLNQTTVSSIELGAAGTRLETVFRMLAALDLEMIIRSKVNPSSVNGDHW